MEKSIVISYMTIQYHKKTKKMLLIKKQLFFYIILYNERLGDIRFIF